MKNIKIYLLILMGGLLFLAQGRVNAEEYSLEKDLNYQLTKEIKQNLQVPLLRYSNDNLKGIVSVLVQVNSNGKIMFISVESTNSSLLLNAEKKLGALNLWTDKRLAGRKIQYTINFS